MEQIRGFHAEFHKNTASSWHHVLIFYTWEGLQQPDSLEKHVSPPVHHVFWGSEGFRELWGAAEWSWLQHLKGNVLPHCLPSTLRLTKHTTPNPNCSLGLTKHTTPNPNCSLGLTKHTTPNPDLSLGLTKHSTANPILDGFESIKLFLQREIDF